VEHRRAKEERGAMYKASVRWLIRRNIGRLNQGDYAPTLAMFAEDATLAFPGDNTWSTMIRPVRKGRDAVVTHRLHRGGTTRSGRPERAI